MNKVVCTLVTAAVLVSGSAVAQDRNKSVVDKQSKQPLRDSQMDGVTAGSSVAIGGAAVTTSNAGAVRLSGGALGGATSVNIVNSTDNAIANGVNVYDSSLVGQGETGGAKVNQTNTLQQTANTTATVQVHAEVVPALLNAIAAATATDIAAGQAQISTNNNYSVDLSGTAEQNATALNILNSAGGMVADGINVAHTANMNATPTLNQINAITQSGLAPGGAIAIDSAAVTTGDTGSISLSDGALSGAKALNIVNSTNSAVGNGINVYDSSLTVQDVTGGSPVNQSNTISQTGNTGSSATVQVAAAIAPLALNATANGNATNIAADTAKINSVNNYSVDLAGTAEQNATALNIVNSAGGMVASGINIAHSANINSMPALNQVNTISQVR